jgi:hypothetical protein
MPKKREISDTNSSDKTGKSSVEVIVAKYGFVAAIITAILGLLGVAITAYFNYAASQPQVIKSIDATQTFAPQITTPTQPTFTVTTAPNTPLPAVASPQALTAPLVTTQKIACIIDQQESGTSAKVSAESLFYSSTALGRIQELPLVSGQKIPFNSIKSFDVVEIHEKTIGGVKVAITLLTGDIIVGVVVSSQYQDSRLVGTTDYGSFELRFLELKRVEFREEGTCQ